MGSVAIMKTYWDVAFELQNTAQSFVVVTVIGSRGSAPQDAGAKAIIVESGLHWGTVGGGKVEARAILHGQEILKQNKAEPELFTWNLQRDIGMSCGGEITYLFEVHRYSTWPIVVFGAGHVSQALIRLLINLNCQVTCVDSRTEWLDKLPDAFNLKKFHAEDPSLLVETLHKNCFFVIMTQGHAMDLPILKQLYTRFPDAAFVGNIGSVVKGLKLRKELIEFGIKEEVLKDFHCPIGIPLGKNHPYEIAVSVSAQLIQERDRIFDPQSLPKWETT
ncbi:xanthine dehydrogenase accessory protein XdhC [Bdellovibrio sp. qaytius]|nr:xanthine dehydrogenase accessory protein XdhC [Bdellovibrio sp. qaytius]